ncbi:MAG: extracellular solute-binding protein [Clostridia bacterium]|nr:extracellular solute-binding protein [Clostridia bacterium]
MTKKIVSVLLCVLMVLSVCVTAFAEETANQTVTDETVTDGALAPEVTPEQNNVDLSTGLIVSSTRYYKYFDAIKGTPVGTDNIIIQGEDFIAEKSSEDVVQYSENSDRFSYNGSAVKTNESSIVTWKFKTEHTGRYNITVHYTTESAKDRTAERGIYIDGVMPFTAFSSVAFERTWTDKFQAEDQGYGYGENRFEVDAIGSEIRPESYIVDNLISKTIVAGDGTNAQIYIETGEHELTFQSHKETLVIDYIEITAPKDAVSYSSYLSAAEKSGVKKYTGSSIQYEGEQMSSKSIFAIYASSDRTNSAVSPASSGGTTLNIIGTSSWSANGDWVEWTVNAPEDGLYNIGVKYRQSAAEGLFVSRRVYINGEVPFKEAEAVRFEYVDEWTIKRIGDDEGNPFFFHLNKGENTIRLEVTQGDMYNITEQLTDSLNAMNEIYRGIMSITGTSPDKYRDYDFDEKIPEVIERMPVVVKELNTIKANIIEQCGNDKAQILSMIDKLVRQLELMYDDPVDIPTQFAMYKSNTGSLGDSINSLTQQAMSLDYILIAGEEEELDASSNFFEDLWFQIELFINSFILDYSSPDSMDKALDSSSEGLMVWISSGRDQAQIIRNAVKNDPSLDINVTVRLVVGGALLPSILSGVGPDVYLGIGNDDPVNYAVRGAVEDLSKFADFDEVAKRFTQSAMEPFVYEGGVYALPQQHVFSMMFYRTDILEELEISVPKTWDELLYTVTLLSRNNLEVGFSPSMGHYLTLLYQNGEELYQKDENGSYTKINFESDAAISAFETFCSFYTEYSMPVDFDFSNRFRSGEMPIGIVDYTSYNQLTVFAPEIKGLWKMAPIPGNIQYDEAGNVILDEQGNPVINNVCVSGSTGNIVVSGLSEEKKQLAWTFIKWWTSRETQATFCTEMESLLGAAAKQPTANIEALESLAWTTEEITNLSAQQQMTQGTPVVPGNYMVNRQWKFAYDTVYNSSGSPTEELEDTIVTINEELAKKRKEFQEINKNS